MGTASYCERKLPRIVPINVGIVTGRHGERRTTKSIKSLNSIQYVERTKNYETLGGAVEGIEPTCLAALDFELGNMCE